MIRKFEILRIRRDEWAPNRHLMGSLCGMAVPAVVRYGYGYVQGADAAAAEMGADVTVEYVYGNQFFGDADITAYMDNWYQTLGVEVVFACGGGIYSSGRYRPNSTLISVDLPAPFSPSKAWISPFLSCKVISSFALIPGNSLVMFSISMTYSGSVAFALISSAKFITPSVRTVLRSMIGSLYNIFVRIERFFSS